MFDALFEGLTEAVVEAFVVLVFLGSPPADTAEPLAEPVPAIYLQQNDPVPPLLEI